MVVTLATDRTNLSRETKKRNKKITPRFLTLSLGDTKFTKDIDGWESLFRSTLEPKIINLALSGLSFSRAC